MNSAQEIQLEIIDMGYSPFQCQDWRAVTKKGQWIVKVKRTANADEDWQKLKEMLLEKPDYES